MADDSARFEQPLRGGCREECDRGGRHEGHDGDCNRSCRAGSEAQRERTAPVMTHVDRKEGDMRTPAVRARDLARIASLAICVALATAWTSSAQSIRPSVTGVVTDSSGAVLPGVTVEVASPAL